MNTVQRSNPIIRKIRRIVFRMPERKYFISGDRACRQMMQSAHRRRRKPDPEADSIFARAVSELRAEIRSGFWDQTAACTVYTVL